MLDAKDLSQSTRDIQPYYQNSLPSEYSVVRFLCASVVNSAAENRFIRT